MAQNISHSNQVMKKILKELVTNEEKQDVHLAILWNLDQIISLNNEIRNTFRLSELILTLLNQGILNPELIQLKSLKAIINEGLKLFPTLRFPLEVNRYQLEHIVKVLKVQRIGRLKYVMSIPLMEVQKYEVFTLISHPIKISSSELAIPKIKDTILKYEDQSYITTSSSNMFSISETQHVLLEVEPIYRQSMLTCEWAAFNGDIPDMMKICEKSNSNFLV